MAQGSRLPIAVACSLAALAGCASAPPSPTPPPIPVRFSAPALGSTITLEPDTPFSYIADADNRELHRVDLASGAVVSSPLPGAPEQLVRLGMGTLAVTLRDRNEVALVEVAPDGSARVTATASVATEPWGVSMAPSGDLLVTSAWGHTLTALATNPLRVRWSLDVPREPRSIVITSDGRRAFVTHLVGNAVTVVDLSSDAPNAHPLPALGGALRNRVD